MLLDRVCFCFLLSVFMTIYYSVYSCPGPETFILGGCLCQLLRSQLRVDLKSHYGHLLMYCQSVPTDRLITIMPFFLPKLKYLSFSAKRQVFIRTLLLSFGRDCWHSVSMPQFLSSICFHTLPLAPHNSNLT